MDIIVEIAINEPTWQTNTEFNESFFKRLAADVLALHPNWHACQEAEISLLLTNDDEIKRLNKEFRMKDKPTNVLSFPDVDIPPKSVLRYAPPNSTYLGDIAFSYQTICKEAELYNISLSAHMHHLFIHSILHLIGYDHMQDEEANIMEAIEEKLLAKYGIDSPYK